MLEELQSRIETAHGRLTGLSDDIAQMKSIEDALTQTNKSITESADDLRSFLDTAGRTHQSLVETADAFKDAAKTLETIDVSRLHDLIDRGNNEIRSELSRTATKSHDDLENMAARIFGSVSDASDKVRNHIDKNHEIGLGQLQQAEARLIAEQNTRTATTIKQIEATTADRLDRVDRRVSTAIVASGEATIKQIESNASQINAATHESLQPLKLIVGATLILAIGILAILVLLLINS